MTTQELLEKIKIAYDQYMNNNRGLPRYRGLPDWMEAFIEYIDGGGEDFSGVRREIETLQEQIDALGPGLSEEAVQARIDASLGSILQSINEIIEKNGQQDTAIKAIEDALKLIPTDTAITALQDALNALQGRLDTNDETDRKQSEAITALQDALKVIPTDTAITALQDSLNTLQGRLDTNDETDKRQDTEIKSLDDWRNETIASLADFLSRLRTVESGTETIQQVKTELLGQLRRIEKDLEDGLKPLAGLPASIENLEIRLGAIKPGIDEQGASNIAAEKVAALRQEIELRLNPLVSGAVVWNTLDSRLTAAQADIIKLYGLVSQGGGGTPPTGGVNEAYVQAELKKLEVLLQGEITTLKTSISGLLQLPGRLNAIEQELLNKTTVEQVKSLIQTEIADLVSNSDLTNFENDIREHIRKKLEELETDFWKKLPNQSMPQGWIEAVTNLIWKDLPEQPVPPAWINQIAELIWKDLPGQPMPPDWIKKVEQIAGDLDSALLANLLLQLQDPESKISAILAAADEHLKTAILELVAKEYATIEQLNIALGDLSNTINTRIDELPSILSEEEVKGIAAGLVQAITDELKELNPGERLAALEAYRKKIEELELGKFIQTIKDWDIPGLADKIEALEDLIEKLEKEVSEAAASDTALRIARVCLNGWGIAGGLEIYSDPFYHIHVSAGQGVTPNGELIILPEAVCLKGYEKLEGGDRPGDPFFSDIDIWELFPKGTNGNKRRSLTPQTQREKDQPFSADKVVLVMPGPRFLLINRDDYLRKINVYTPVRQLENAERTFQYADYTFSKTFSPADQTPADDNLYRAFHPALRLPSIPLYRFGFRPGDDCRTEELDQTEFPSKITSLRNLYDTWKPITEEALNHVNKQSGRLIKEYHDLLFPQLPRDTFQNKLDILLTNWNVYTGLAEIKNEENPKMCYMQYFYDWARDLIQAYHECRDELQWLMADLCLLTPETLSARSRYLALGPAWRPAQDGLAAPLRDEFRQPPIFNGNAERWEKTRLYYCRLFELMESFYIEGALGKEEMPEQFQMDDDDPFQPDFSRIKITPGKKPGSLLETQAIPFYYPLSAGAGSLHHYWSYRHTKTRRHDQLLSYHASDDQNSYNDPDDWHITRPLFFTMDEYDFYRVEGFIGKKEIQIDGFNFNTEKNNIRAAIRYLAHKHNLNFDVVEKKISDDLAQSYLKQGTNSITHSFIRDMLGAEHLGGVPKGGTLIVILDEDGIAIGDFSLPYRLDGATLVVEPIELP